MVTQNYQIESHKIMEILHFKGFFQGYAPKIDFKESEKDGVTYFELNFNNIVERDNFNTEFRKLTGLPPFGN
jgi:hypothetical protein